MKKFKLKEKGKFVIVIGDDGAVLTYFVDKKLTNRLFCLSSKPVDTKEFTELFSKHPEYPIYLLIDCVEQSYVKQVLPAISSLSIGKLVRKRLERDFVNTDIKGAYLIGRSEAGRKDWIYIFTSISMTENLSQWLSYFSELPNPVVGIYTLPIEMGAIVKKINKEIFVGENKPKDWQILVTHNKTGGFRQVVMNKGQVIFTRLIRAGKDTIPDIIAGNIEQEILNTVDYLRRLSFAEGDGIDVMVVVASDIKKSLIDVKIRGHNILVFTPSEICIKLNLNNVSTDSDKFADLFLAAYFSYSKPVLRLFTPQIKKDNNLLLLDKYLTMALIGMAILMVPYFIFILISIFSLNSEISQLTKDKIVSETKWKDTQSSYRYNLNDSDKIMDAVSVYNKLSASDNNPLDLINKLYEVQKNFASTSSLSINYYPDTSSKNNKSINSGLGKFVVNLVANLKFYNMGNSPEELFKNFDDFSGRIKTQFNGYDIEHSKLPDKISSGTINNKLDVLITVKTK